MYFKLVESMVTGSEFDTIQTCLQDVYYHGYQNQYAVLVSEDKVPTKRKK